MLNTLFNTNYACPICNRLHAIRQCTQFVVMNVEQKLRIVAQKSLCYNCLAQSHGRGKCNSIDRCRRCMQDHNSWLHPMPEGRVWVQMTAYVRIIPRPGREACFTRALLDPTAARSAIMSTEAKELQCLVNNGRTFITVYHSRDEGRRIEVECVVENKSYGRSPISDVEGLNCAKSVNANRKWNRSLEYRLILGADVQSKIFIDPAKGSPGQIYVQDTIFGFAYFGEAEKKV